jgi:hypothetical protein
MSIGFTQETNDDVQKFARAMNIDLAERLR